MAKALGAYVVGVCSTANVQLVKDLGADEVVDYKTANVIEKYRNQDFDIVFDAVDSAVEVCRTSPLAISNGISVSNSHVVFPHLLRLSNHLPRALWYPVLPVLDLGQQQDSYEADGQYDPDRIFRRGFGQSLHSGPSSSGNLQEQAGIVLEERARLPLCV